MNGQPIIYYNKLRTKISLTNKYLKINLKLLDKDIELDGTDMVF